MSMQTWGVRIYGVELTQDDMKTPKLGEFVEEQALDELEMAVSEAGGIMPRFMGFDCDADGRVFLGYYPCYPWHVDDDAPKTEAEAQGKIREIAAYLVKDPDTLDYSDFVSYNFG